MKKIEIVLHVETDAEARQVVTDIIDKFDCVYDWEVSDIN
jgi:hypothetical protein